MIEEIVVPETKPGEENCAYQRHCDFIKKYAELNRTRVVVGDRSDFVANIQASSFSISIDGQQAIIDTSDQPELSGQRLSLPCFKFHYCKGLHAGLPLTYPIAPILDFPGADDYRAFFRLAAKEIYSCNTDLVIGCRLPRENAKGRGRKVRGLLKEVYGSQADTSFQRSSHRKFWNKHRSCLVAVGVPGPRKNILGWGHYEQMALGVCVIVPPVDTVLPYAQELVPGKHYISCEEDYGDLVEKIEWCKRHREECRQIGRNARQLFLNYCMPDRFWRWIAACLEKPDLLGGPSHRPPVSGPYAHQSTTFRAS